MNNIQHEIETNIGLAVSPFGDEVSLRERKRAIDFLLSVPEKSFPILMQLIRNEPIAFQTPELINIVGLFRNDQSIELLSYLLLQGTPETSRSAGRSLGMLDSPLANKALKKGLSVNNVEVKIAAIEGIRVSRNKLWCKQIKSFLNDSDSNLRYYAVNTAVELGCININLLSIIAEQDSDLNIRELSSKLIEKFK